MSRFVALALLTVLAAAPSACKKQESSPATLPPPASGGGASPAPQTPPAVDAARDAVDSAAAKAAEVFKASKDQAVAAGQQGMDSIKAGIQSLRDKAPSIPELARGTYTQSVDSLDAGFKDLQVKFEVLQNSTAETFEKLRADFEPALKSLSDQVSALTSKFGK
jgi:hypothetical protein